MPSLVRLLIIPVGLLIGIACTHSGLDRSTPTGDTSSTPTSAQDCPWVGTWDLESVNCSTFPYDEWGDTYDSAKLEIDHDPAGGCTVTSTLEGPECKRIESWHFDLPTGTSVDVRFDGISDCVPNRCLFDVGGDECKNGELAEDDPRTLTIDESNGTMQAVGLLADTAGGCPLDVVTTWDKK